MSNFLNSSQWREFQESVGNKTFTLGTDAYAIKLDLPFGKSFLYSPSPTAAEHLDKVREIGRAENTIFFKWEPMLQYQEARSTYKEELQPLGFLEAKKALQPQKTILIDLMKSDEELLQAMHHKTRYNIRLAEKKGVRVSICDHRNEDAFPQFWAALQLTAKRDGFHLHQKEYYQKLVAISNVKLFRATIEVHGAPAYPAFALVIFYRNRVTYLHGASDDTYRAYMAPHLLHWEIMRYAKKTGNTEYDFWGIDEKKWPGITRFKRGFGGRDVEYLGSFDLPLKKLWYALYRLKSCQA